MLTALLTGPNVVAILVLILAFYLLVIRGLLWPLLGLGVCWFAAKGIVAWYPPSGFVVGTVMSHPVTAAFIGACVVCACAVGLIIGDDD